MERWNNGESSEGQEELRILDPGAGAQLPVCFCEGTSRRRPVTGSVTGKAFSDLIKTPISSVSKGSSRTWIVSLSLLEDLITLRAMSLLSSYH